MTKEKVHAKDTYRDLHECRVLANSIAAGSTDTLKEDSESSVWVLGC